MKTSFDVGIGTNHGEKLSDAYFLNHENAIPYHSKCKEDFVAWISLRAAAHVLVQALRASVEATLSASSIRNGHFESISAATRAPAGMSLRGHNVSPKCKISHSLSSSRIRPATSVVRRVGPTKMELETTATTTSEAGDLLFALM